MAAAVLLRLDSPAMHEALSEDTTAPDEARALEEAIEADAARAATAGASSGRQILTRPVTGRHSARATRLSTR